MWCQGVLCIWESHALCGPIKSDWLDTIIVGLNDWGRVAWLDGRFVCLGAISVRSFSMFGSTMACELICQEETPFDREVFVMQLDFRKEVLYCLIMACWESDAVGIKWKNDIAKSLACFKVQVIRPWSGVLTGHAFLDLLVWPDGLSYYVISVLSVTRWSDRVAVGSSAMLCCHRRPGLSSPWVFC